MNIHIQSIHFTVDKQLKEFIKRKINKLINIDDSILKVEVFLKVDKPESYNNKIVEIKLNSSSHEYFAKKTVRLF